MNKKYSAFVPSESRVLSDSADNTLSESFEKLEETQLKQMRSFNFSDN